MQTVINEIKASSLNLAIKTNNNNIPIRLHTSFHSITNKEKDFHNFFHKEFEMFCPQIAEHFGRPLRLKKCLYAADFSSKSWYNTLDNFLQKDMGFQHSRVEGCIYIYIQKGK